VIDSGALRGEDFERVTRQYAETGRLDTSAPGVYAKGSEPGGKREVGIGHPKEDPSASGTRASETRLNTAKPERVPERSRNETIATPSRDSSKRVPEYAVSTASDSAVEIVVRLPELRGGMASVDLDTSETALSLRSPEYELAVTLPRRADPEGTTAKFSSKRKTLTVVLPTYQVR
jgi:HSP20 family molecular chaperone IbpA